MKTTAAPSRSNPGWRFLLIPGLALLTLLIAFRIVSRAYYADTDFFTFWLAGRLAITGGNPYSSQAWIAGHQQFGATWVPNSTFIYPLPLSLLFAGLGLLPAYQANVVRVALSQ